MKGWIKGGLIGGIIITIMYFFSIFATLLKLEQVFLVHSLVGLFMWLLRISDWIVDSYYPYTIFLSFDYYILLYCLKIKNTI